MSKGTAVAKIESPGSAVLPPELAELAAQFGTAGLEDMTQDDRTTPFILLLQSLSPQIDEDSDAYVEGAKAGDFLNTVTREVWHDGLKVIPVLFQKVWNVWIPRKEGGGFLGSYGDAALTEELFVPQRNEPWEGGQQVNETANHWVLVQSADGTWTPAIISMKVTALKSSRNWNSLVTMNAQKYNAPVYAFAYVATSVKQTNDKGTFHNFKFENAGFATAGLLKMAYDFRAAIKSGLVKADPTKAGETDTTATEEVTEKDPGRPKF